MSAQRPLILYIAISLDGFIATKDDNISFLDMVAAPGEDYGYADFTSGVDTVIMGRRTYEKVAAMGYPDPHPGRTLYVLSSGKHDWPAHVHAYSGDPQKLLQEIRQQPGKVIYCDGGAALVQSLLQSQLIDEIIVSVIPVLLGQGISLFGAQGRSARLSLVSSKAFASGLVQLHYSVDRLSEAVPGTA